MESDGQGLLNLALQAGAHAWRRARRDDENGFEGRSSGAATKN
jgi:hypothetical protein